MLLFQKILIPFVASLNEHALSTKKSKWDKLNPRLVHNKSLVSKSLARVIRV